MEEPTLKQKTAKGLFWGAISNGMQQLIAAVFGIYLARTLNPDDYGLVGMLAIFTGISIILINGGFSVALTNKKNASHEDYNAFFWFAVFTGFVLYIILFACAPLIAGFFYRPELVPLARVLFIPLVFSGMGTVSHTVMFKKMMTKQRAVVDIVTMLTSLSVALILAIMGFAYWALAIQMVIQAILGSVLLFIIAPWKPTFNINFSPLKEMLPFSIKLFLTNIFQQIAGSLFSVIFGRFYGAIQVGIYNQGQKWMMMGSQFIAGMINYVTQPVLVQINTDKDRQVAVLRKLIRFGAFVSFPLMLGLAFVGKEFILITVGDKWLPSVPFLQLFCLWGAFGYLWNLFTNLIVTHGKSDIYMWITIVTGLLQLAVVVCVYPFGIFPMVIAYLAMNFAGLFIWQYSVYKLVRLQLKMVLGDVFPYLAITLSCFFIAWLFTKNIENIYVLFIAKIVISAILYVLILKKSNSVIFKESWDYFRHRL
jgi:O-antigen/teichoic acid export membrane protein